MYDVNFFYILATYTNEDFCMMYFKQKCIYRSNILLENINKYKK